MTERQFDYKFRDRQIIDLTENYMIFRKPLSLTDVRKEDEVVKFKSLTEMLDYVLDDGRTVRSIIETWTELPELPPFSSSAA